MTGSTRPTPNYDGKPDAEKLRKAMKGIGTDEKELIAIIANRTVDELQKVRLEFKTLFGRDLVEDVTSETSGNFRVALLGRLQTPAHHDAEVLKNAIVGAGTDEAALIEVLASRSNAQIKAIKDEYLLITKRPLEKDIIGDTSGDFKRFLVSLVQGNRDESNGADHGAAAADAQAFYKAGEGKWGTDEEKFNQILASRSFAQLRLINEEYKKISKKDLIAAVESEISGWLRDAFKAVLKIAVYGHAEYFAERLYLSMKGAGTDDKTLIRIITSRADIDMVEIREAFQRKYGKSLSKFVEEDTSGDYKRFLVDLVN